MIELLVLYILHNNTLSLYEIQQILKNKFRYLLSGSFGSIHPILQKLLKTEYILSQKKLSKGGKPCIHYKITKNGKKYFEEIIKSQDKINSKIIETKLTCLDICPESTKEEIIQEAEIFYKTQIIILNNLINSNDYNEIQQNQIKNLIQYYEIKKCTSSSKEFLKK